MNSDAMAPCKPFLKWPGGKRWLCPALLRIISGVEYHRYFEPFLGGGALFFALRPARAILSDVNPELINVYQQVKRMPHRLIKELRAIPVADDAYDAIRRDTTSGSLRNAVRFLFLNRTAFGGMYRLNQRGEFNVPFGGGQRRPDVLWTSGLMLSTSRALRNAQLNCEDFEKALRMARKGDLAFCDPTYTVTHNNNGFVRYNESNFRWCDQERLASLCLQLRRKGVTVIVTNAFHKEIRCLYRDAIVHEVDRPSTLCPSPEKRRQTKEYVFLLKP
jgi:DNA adenine methylase